MTTHKQRVDRLRLANIAYASGQPFMTEDEYHILWQEIYRASPDQPELYHTGASPIRPGLMMPHSHRVYGYQKAFNMEDLKVFRTRFPHDKLLLQPKYDGCAAVLYRRSPTETILVREDDGLIGENITRHMAHIQLPDISTLADRTSVELIIRNQDWDETYGANQRNVVSGWVNSYDMPDYAKVTAIPHEHGPEAAWTETENLDDLLEAIMYWYSVWSDKYPIDGIMLKLADQNKRIVVGHSATCYNWAIAWKPPMQMAWTTVRQISYSIGRSSSLIPVVTYDPITLCKTVNQRATAHNARWLVDHGIIPGAKILIGKAGEIIPKIVACSNKDKSLVSLPTVCPVCGAPLKMNGAHLQCTGSYCLEQMCRKVYYFYSIFGMNIKGIGPYSINAIMEDATCRKVLLNAPWALMLPKKYPALAKYACATWGIAKYADFYEQCQVPHTVVDFITSLGLPRLARNKAVRIYNEIGCTQQTNPRNYDYVAYAAAIKIFNAVRNDFPEKYWIDVPYTAQTTYCITGKLSCVRTDFIAKMLRLGWVYHGSVSRKINYLVVAEHGQSTTKYSRAKRLGIHIITETEAMKEAKNGKEN